MAAQKKKARSSQGASSPIGKIIFIILLYGLAVLLTYITLAKPQDGTAMGSIRTLLFGLAGSFPILISVFFAYLATVGVLSFGEHKIESWRAFLDGLLFLFFLTAVHLFTAEAVIRNRMTILTFANFVSKSYSYGKGGGALGALVSWPLYRYLGAWGGLLIVILLIVLDLTLSGRAGSFLHWIEESTAGYREESQQRREERRDERQAQDAERRERQTERRRVEARPQNPKRDEDIFFDELDDFGFVDSPKKPRKSYHEYDNDMPRRVNDAMQLPTRKPPRVSRFTEDAEPKPKRPKAEKPAESAKSDRQAEWDNTVDILQEEPKKQDKIHLAKTDERTLAAFDGSNRDEDRPKAHVDRPEMKKKPERKMKAEEVEPKQEKKPEKKPKPELMPRENEADPLPIVPDESDVIEPTAESSNHMVTEYEGEEEYYYPPIDLLTAGERVAENHRDADMEKAKKLAETLEQFGISSKLTGIAHGPAVTRFELLPAPGVKVSKITNLADDIAMHLAAMSVRIEAPIPGKSAVGVEIPNDKIEMVRLRDVLESKAACDMVSKVAVGLGKDNSGRYIVADIAKMPHVLIAGQTGSGKSVCINAIITSILFRATPKEVRLILIDPKVVELSIYNDIPHLVCPVVTDCKKAASALQWAVSEMLMRYKRFAERGVRDIKGYNKNLKDGEEIMPQMVIIIDELADLMMVAPGEVEDSICRLAQLARAAGMHLVIATQRPSVNVVTGIIKANIPTRIAFSVASQVDSRTMIDHGGAEKLLGNGDMLFVPSGINKPMRVQGAWVSDEEVHAIVDYIKEGSSANYDVDMIEKMENAARSDAENEEVSKEYDSKLPEATEIVVEAGQASVSMLQRRMRIGYARAGRLIDEMQRRGIVSEADGSKPREVLITREQMQNMFNDDP